MSAPPEDDKGFLDGGDLNSFLADLVTSTADDGGGAAAEQKQKPPAGAAGARDEKESSPISRGPHQVGGPPVEGAEKNSAPEPGATAPRGRHPRAQPEGERRMRDRSTGRRGDPSPSPRGRGKSPTGAGAGSTGSSPVAGTQPLQPRRRAPHANDGNRNEPEPMSYGTLVRTSPDEHNKGMMVFDNQVLKVGQKDSPRNMANMNLAAGAKQRRVEQARAGQTPQLMSSGVGPFSMDPGQVQSGIYSFDKEGLPQSGDTFDRDGNLVKKGGGKRGGKKKPGGAGGGGNGGSSDDGGFFGGFLGFFGIGDDEKQKKKEQKKLLDSGSSNGSTPRAEKIGAAKQRERMLKANAGAPNKKGLEKKKGKGKGVTKAGAHAPYARLMFCSLTLICTYQRLHTSSPRARYHISGRPTGSAREGRAQ